MYRFQPFVDWVEENPFYIRDTWDFEKNQWAGPGRLGLFDWQKKIFRECLSQNEDGKFPYQTIIFSTVKKEGKTLSAAAVGSWFADQAPDGTEIYIIANTQEQAEGRVMKDMKYHYKKWNETQEFKAKLTQYQIVLPNETTITALPRNAEAVAGSRHAMTLFDELWGCCDSSTEIYTKNGWKSYSDLSIGELVATWRDGVFEWNPVQSINVYPYDGDMVRLKHRRCDMLLTPNHRVLGRWRTSGRFPMNDQTWEFRSADEASVSFEGEVPTQSSWVGEERNSFSIGGMTFDMGDWMEFLGYYLSEGSTYGSKKSGNLEGIVLSQSMSAHPEVCERIARLLSKMGLKYHYYTKGEFRIPGTRVIAEYFHSFGKCYEKYVDEQFLDLKSEYLNRFIDAFADGDGWLAGYGYQFEITSKRLIDDIASMGMKCGYTVRYMGCRRRKDTFGEKRGKSYNVHPTYRLSLSRGRVCYDKRRWSREYYRGIVWCPTVRNGTWLARRNGCVYWTGNSTSDRDRRVWDELTPIPTIPYSLRFVSSYAGFIGESELLWDLYKAGVGKDEHEDGQGQIIPGLEDLPCWKSGRMFTYWNHQPRMPWGTSDYYLDQIHQLRPAAYLRLHENRWVTTHETFIPIEWWDEAASHFPKPPEYLENFPFADRPVCIGVDGSTTEATTAVVGCTYLPKQKKAAILFHRIWKPTGDNPMDMTSVEDYILERSKRYNVISVGYDPAQLHQAMTHLARLGIPTHPIPQQGTHMVKASQTLYDLLKYKNLMAYPDDDLKAHIQQAVAEDTGAGFRIVKQAKSRTARRVIDAAIAMAIATYEAIDRMGTVIDEPLVIDMPFSDASAWKYEDPMQKIFPFPFRSD